MLEAWIGHIDQKCWDMFGDVNEFHLPKCPLVICLDQNLPSYWIGCHWSSIYYQIDHLKILPNSFCRIFGQNLSSQPCRWGASGPSHHLGYAQFGGRAPFPIDNKRLFWPMGISKCQVVFLLAFPAFRSDLLWSCTWTMSQKILKN